MSRATHDFECQKCHAQGKVSYDVIKCPECGESIEGQAITGEALEALLERIRVKHELSQSVSISPEAKG